MCDGRVIVRRYVARQYQPTPGGPALVGWGGSDPARLRVVASSSVHAHRARAHPPGPGAPPGVASTSTAALHVPADDTARQ